jgi:dienelactone hydrolase
MVIVFVLATACATIQQTAPPADEAQHQLSRARQPADERFRYQPAPVEADNHIIRTGGSYELRRLRFPSAGDNGQPENLVTVDYHRSARPGRHPAVVVLPIWGRHLYPSNKVTKALRSRSNGRLHVLNVLGPEFLFDWATLGATTDEDEFIAAWAEGVEREVATITDIRRLIDWAETRPEIDAGRIGLVGFSHGAMMAPTAAAIDSRLSALALVMGGALPHTVAARCQGSRTGTIQQHAAEAFGWSSDEMESRLEPLFAPIDPANYPGRIDPNRVIIFEAGLDECVPEASREALWEAVGRPERYTIMAGHRRAFFTLTPLYLNWMRTKIWTFFERVLLEGYADSENRRDEVP